MSGRKRMASDAFNDRRGFPPGGALVCGPPIPIHPPPHTAILEEEIEIQREEMRRLIDDNRRLAEDRVVLQQELGAARDEIRHMNVMINDFRAEHEHRSRDLIDKSRKLEGDLRSTEPLKKEVVQLRAEVQKLEKIRQELVGQVQSFSKDFVKLQSENKQIPMLRGDLDSLQQEVIRARGALDYENKSRVVVMEQTQAMQHDLFSATREVEKLKAEIVNGSSSSWAPGAPYGMKLISPEGGYPAPYGDLYGHHVGSVEKAPLYGSRSGGWGGIEKPRGGRR